MERWTKNPELWEARVTSFLHEQFQQADAAHDVQHVRRVVQTAGQLAAHEKADLNIVLPAAWLHDCVYVPKNAPERKFASALAARTASAFLRKNNYDEAHLPAISHAIEAHSFSAGIIPETKEAKVLQDADRLDALGAIGIARCFITGASFGIPLYNPVDPFCIERSPDEQHFMLDHFYQKLFTLERSMKTESGKLEAARRTVFMREFVAELGLETGHQPL